MLLRVSIQALPEKSSRLGLMTAGGKVPLENNRAGSVHDFDDLKRMGIRSTFALFTKTVDYIF